MIATDVVDDRPGVDFSDVEHILHPKIQNQWNTRCWVANLSEHITGYQRARVVDATRDLARREHAKVLGPFARLLFA